AAWVGRLGGDLLHGGWLGAGGFEGLGGCEERLREADEARLRVNTGARIGVGTSLNMPQRDLQRESAPFADGRLYGHGAVHEPSQLRANAQTQTSTTILLAQPEVSLYKRLEDLALHVLWYAGPRVLHLKFEVEISSRWRRRRSLVQAHERPFFEVCVVAGVRDRDLGALVSGGPFPRGPRIPRLQGAPTRHYVWKFGQTSDFQDDSTANRGEFERVRDQVDDDLQDSMVPSGPKSDGSATVPSSDL
ncbi:7130_t:CDS:2, partial [Scutellospora calospora]